MGEVLIMPSRKKKYMVPMIVFSKCEDPFYISEVAYWKPLPEHLKAYIDKVVTKSNMRIV